ncbi:MAG: hypothetical protein ACLUIX_00370 [Oscillospiraceae bacterium]
MTGWSSWEPCASTPPVPTYCGSSELVAQADREGRIPFIIGSLGIGGHGCGQLVGSQRHLSGPEELEKMAPAGAFRQSLSLTAVAQTTCIRTI